MPVINCTVLPGRKVNVPIALAPATRGGSGVVPSTVVASDAVDTQLLPGAVERLAHKVFPSVPALLLNDAFCSADAPAQVEACNCTGAVPFDVTEVTSTLLSGASQVFMSTGTLSKVIDVVTVPFRMCSCSWNELVACGASGSCAAFVSGKSWIWPNRARGLSIESCVV